MLRLTTFAFLVLFILTSAGVSNAAKVYLVNGDKLNGEITSDTADSITITSSVLGDMNIPKSKITKIRGYKQESISIDKTVDTSGEAKWTRKITLGYSMQDGNTETQDLHGEFLIDRKSDQYEAYLKGSIDYGETGEIMDTQKWILSSRVSSVIWRNADKELNPNFIEALEAEKVNAFFQVDVDHARFSDIDYRVIPSIGISYWWADRDDWKARLDTGLGYTRTKYRSTGDSEDDISFIPTLYLEKLLFGETRLSEELKYLAPVDDFMEYRLISTTKLSTKISDGLSFNVTLINDYDDSSNKTGKPNDMTLTSSLSYEF